MRLKIAAIIILLTCLNINVQHLQAQGTLPLALVCVMPTGMNASAPYVIVFRNSSVFGAVFPIAANISIFSNQRVNAVLHRVTTDAPTGGYRLGLEVARLASDPNLLNSNDCAEDIAQLAKALNISVNQNTLPVPVAPQYGLTVQIGGDNQLNNPYLGVFGFQLQSTNDGSSTNFQVAQVSASDPVIQLSLSKITSAAPTTFVVIGNKPFTVQKSGITNPDVFSSPVYPEDLQYLEAQFNDKIPALVDMMRMVELPIYPSQVLGYISAQPFSGGYLSLGLNSDQAKRFPEFAPDTTVSPLTENIEARLSLPNRPGEPVGKLVGTNSLTVVRVDDNGQLIVRAQDGQEEIIEAWRVKVN